MKWLRLLVRMFLAVTVLLAAAVLIVLGPLREPTTEWLRPRIEALLAAGLDAPVSIAALRLSLAPLQVEAEGIVLGADGALARATRLSVRLLPRTSLRQLRPVAVATADDVFVDVPRWVALLEDDTPSGTPTLVPAFRLRVARVNQAKVRIAELEQPLDVEAASVAGSFTVDALGLFHFTADVDQASLTRGGAALTLTRARGRGGETTAGWRLTLVEASGDGVELASSAPQGDRLPIRGHIELPRLAFASDVFERLAGTAEIDVAAVGRLEDPAFAGTIRVPGLTFDGERIGDVVATADWNEQRLAVSSARLEEAGASAEASGELSMDAPFAFDADVEWTKLDVAQLVDLPEQSVKPFTAAGKAKVTGTLEPLALRAEGGGRLIATASEGVIEWRGQGSYRDGAGEGEVDASQAAAGSGGANIVRARLAIGAAGELSGNVAATVANPTALGAFLPLESLPNVSGALAASAEVGGSTADPRLEGELKGRDVALFGVAMQRVEGRFALDRAAFRTAGITANLWRGSIGLSGTVALDASGDNDWQVRAVDVPGDAVVGLVYGLTGSVPPIGRGTLAGQVSGRGAWPRVQIAGSATMERFWLTRQWIERASLSGDVTWPRWQLDAELRNSGGQTVALRGRGTGVDDVALDAHAAAWPLTALQQGALTESGGTLSLDAALTGPLLALNGSATLRADGLIAGERAIGSVEVNAVATRGRWELSTALFDGLVRLRGRLTPDAGWPLVVDGEWNEANFGPLLAPDTDVAAISTGTLNLSLRLTDPTRFDATVVLQHLQVVNGPYEVTSVRPARLECRRGACTLNELALRGPDTDLRASGRAGADGSVSLRLEGNGDLRLLELAGDAVESARGGFTLDVEVHRARNRWDVDGQVRFDKASLDVGGPAAISRASGRLTLRGTTVRIDQLDGRIGTGSFAVEGAVDLARGPDLTWTLTDVGVDLLPSLEAELSGRGGFDGVWEHMRLSGEIEIARMLYDRDIQLLDFLPTLNRELADAPRPPAARRLDLDLHIVAPGELYVENNIARIEARADLRVTGTADRPQLYGRIEALDGTVTVSSRVFELQGGTVDFRPELGLTAALNITLESTIDTRDATYVVDVRVTGTTREPRVVMSSDDPSLSPTDVATLVAVGQTATQFSQGGDAGFSIALPGVLADPLQQGARQLLPIDRISFESTYSRSTGTFEPQIKLGRDLTDEIAVSLGQTFGLESRTTVEAEYRLTPRVFLTASWESQTSSQEGAFGAGARVRYEFWRVTPYTMLLGWR